MPAMMIWWRNWWCWFVFNISFTLSLNGFHCQLDNVFQFYSNIYCKFLCEIDTYVCMYVWKCACVCARQHLVELLFCIIYGLFVITLFPLLAFHQWHTLHIVKKMCLADWLYLLSVSHIIHILVQFSLIFFFSFFFFEDF